MSKPYIQYISWDDKTISEVRCMKCNKVIATKKIYVSADGDTLLKLVHQTHYRTMSVILEDGSYSNMLICRECLSTITDSDLPIFQKTQRWGWQKDWEFHKKQIAPLSVLKKMFKGKNILKRGNSYGVSAHFI